VPVLIVRAAACRAAAAERAQYWDQEALAINGQIQERATPDAFLQVFQG